MKPFTCLRPAVTVLGFIAVPIWLAACGSPSAPPAELPSPSADVSPQNGSPASEAPVPVEPSPQPEPPLAFWKYRTSGELWSDPTFDPDDPSRVFFGSDDMRIHAVDPRRGTEAWSRSLGAKIRQRPVLAGGKALIVDTGGTLHILSAADGTPITTHRLGAAAADGAFAADGDTFFFGGSDGSVTGRGVDGRRLWHTELDGAGAPRALALDPLRVIAVAGDGQLHALDRLSGARLWTGGQDGAARLSGDTRSAPVSLEHEGRRRLFVTGGGFLWCLDAVDGGERWRRLTHEFVSASPVIDLSGPSPQVLAGGGDSIFAFSLRGDLRWKRKLEGAFRSGPLPVGRHLVVGSGDHLLTLLDPGDGRELWRFETDAIITTALAGRDERLLFGSIGGSLFGLQVELQGHDAPSPPTPRIHVSPTFFDGTPELRHRLRVGPTTAPPQALADGGMLIWTDHGPVVFNMDGEVRWKKTAPHPVPPGDVLAASGPEAPGPAMSAPEMPRTGTPTLLDDLIVTVAPAGRLRALYGEDGAEQWTVPDGKRPGLPIRGVWISPRRTILTHTEDGEVAAFSVAGELLWRRDVGSLASEPRTHGGAVIVGTAGAEIVALNEQNGRELWRRATRAAVSAPVLSHGDTLFVGDTGGTVYALDPAIGGERWSRALGGSFRLAAGALYGTVFVCGDDGRLTALDARSGLPGHRVDLESRCTSPLRLHDGMLYAGTHGGRLHAVNAINGEELWRLAGHEPIQAVAVQIEPDGAPRLWIAERDGGLSVVALP